jgi:hypothetical protein
VSRRWAAPVIYAAFAIAASYGVGAAAQEETIEADPIRCWWRTSVPAVRVGEPFSVVLTCSVLETDTVTVVPNQTELAPNAVQLPPFDVIGGSQGEDLRTADYRFFQYEYRARLISPELFGKDVPLPELKVSYKVRTRVNGDAQEGRDLTYVLPPVSVRVHSLVPGNAIDIRDASRETFQDIDRRLSRANILRLIGGLLIGFSALAALVAVTRVVGGPTRRSPAARTLASDSAILRQVGRELAELQRARHEADWTPALTTRLLTALRILAGYALGTPPTAIAHTDARTEGPGFLIVRGRGFRADEVAVPGSITPAVIAQELKRSAGGHSRAGVLEPLESAMSRLTTAQYGRESAPGEAAIDEALTAGAAALRQLRVDNLWVTKKVRALGARAGLADRLWSR